MKAFNIQILTSHGEYFTSFCGPILQRAAEANDPRAAKQLLHDHYPQGGGWSPFKGFIAGSDYSIKYPGDPRMNPHALITYGDEVVAFYESDWVAVWQQDGTFEICRMD